MPYSSAFTPSPRRRKWLLPTFAAVCFLLGGSVALSRGMRSPLSFLRTDAPLAGWRIDVGPLANSRGSESAAQRFGGRFAPGKVFFVPAGAPFQVTPEPPDAAGMFVELSSDGSWDHTGGELNPPAASVQRCRAPMQPGLYHLSWRSETPGLPDSKTPRLQDSLDVLVLARAETAASGAGVPARVSVNGKMIGAYPDPEKSSVRRVRENAHQYRPPRFFAELTPQTIPIRLGPDFDLGQLVAFKDYHGPDGRKVYTTQRHTDVLPPRPELIDKLIKLRERLRARGVKVTRFWITSGFRTPDYNRSIGGAAFSRHCYGDAVDLCIDEDHDKRMDDLNADGRIDRKDGIIIANACRELEAEGAAVPGGIGVYEWDGEDSVRSHVHIDCRGFITRWGQSGSGKHKKSFTWWPKAEFQEEENGE